jgi:hypothetical protein
MSYGGTSVKAPGHPAKSETTARTDLNVSHYKKLYRLKSVLPSGSEGES